MSAHGRPLPVDRSRVESDVELIADGYLWPPGGRPRRVTGLEAIGEELIRDGIRVSWGDALGRLAVSYLLRLEIVLAPRLVRCAPEVIRDVLTHELGHCVLGTAACEKVRAWQEEEWGELLA